MTQFFLNYIFHKNKNIPYIFIEFLLNLIHLYLFHPIFCTHDFQYLIESHYPGLMIDIADSTNLK